MYATPIPTTAIGECMNIMFDFAREWLNQATEATQKTLSLTEKAFQSKTPEEFQAVTMEGFALARTNTQEFLGLVQKQTQNTQQVVKENVEKFAKNK